MEPACTHAAANKVDLTGSGAKTAAAGIQLQAPSIARHFLGTAPPISPSGHSGTQQTSGNDGVSHDRAAAKVGNAIEAPKAHSGQLQGSRHSSGSSETVARSGGGDPVARVGNRESHSVGPTVGSSPGPATSCDSFKSTRSDLDVQLTEVCSSSSSHSQLREVDIDLTRAESACAKVKNHHLSLSFAVNS